MAWVTLLRDSTRDFPGASRVGRPLSACARQMRPGRQHPRAFLQSEREGARNGGFLWIWTSVLQPGAQGAAGRSVTSPYPGGSPRDIQTAACGPGSRRVRAQNTDRRPVIVLHSCCVFKQNFDLACVSFMEKIVNWGVGKIKCGPGSVHLLYKLATRLLPACLPTPEFIDLRGPWQVHSRDDSEVVICVTPEAGPPGHETCRVPCSHRAWLSSWPGRNRPPWVISLGTQDRAAPCGGPRSQGKPACATGYQS